jgi:hypothetical protein
MANQRLTDKTALGQHLAADDKLMLVDTSDTTGSADGTSKSVENKYIIQTDKVEISNAEYLALDTAEKILVAAPGSGYVIIPIQVYLQYTEGGTKNSVMTNLHIGFKGISTSYYWDFFKGWTTAMAGAYPVSWFFNGASQSQLSSLNTTVDNQTFIMWLGAAPTGTATGTITAYVTYQIIKV